MVYRFNILEYSSEQEKRRCDSLTIITTDSIDVFRKILNDLSQRMLSEHDISFNVSVD